MPKKFKPKKFLKRSTLRIDQWKGSLVDPDEPKTFNEPRNNLEIGGTNWYATNGKAKDENKENSKNNKRDKENRGIRFSTPKNVKKNIFHF